MYSRVIPSRNPAPIRQLPKPPILCKITSKQTRRIPVLEEVGKGKNVARVISRRRVELAVVVASRVVRGASDVAVLADDGWVGPLGFCEVGSEDLGQRVSKGGVERGRGRLTSQRTSWTPQT